MAASITTSAVVAIIATAAHAACSALVFCRFVVSSTFRLVFGRRGFGSRPLAAAPPDPDAFDADVSLTRLQNSALRVRVLQGFLALSLCIFHAPIPVLPATASVLLSPAPPLGPVPRCRTCESWRRCGARGRALVLPPPPQHHVLVHSSRVGALAFLIWQRNRRCANSPDRVQIGYRSGSGV